MSRYGLQWTIASQNWIRIVTAFNAKSSAHSLATVRRLVIVGLTQQLSCCLVSYRTYARMIANLYRLILKSPRKSCSKGLASVVSKLTFGRFGPTHLSSGPSHLSSLGSRLLTYHLSRLKWTVALIGNLSDRFRIAKCPYFACKQFGTLNCMLSKLHVCSQCYRTRASSQGSSCQLHNLRTHHLWVCWLQRLTTASNRKSLPYRSYAAHWDYTTQYTSAYQSHADHDS